MLKTLKKLALRFAMGFDPVCACGGKATLRHHVHGTLNADDVADSGVLFSCGYHKPDGGLVWYDVVHLEDEDNGNVL